MDDGRSLRRDLSQLQQTVRHLGITVVKQAEHIAELVAALAVFGARSERFAQLIDPLAAGFTTVDVTWGTPFPDTAYMVIPVVAAPAPNLGQVFVTAGAKTTDGCTVAIRNTSGAAIAVVLDVLAIRT